MLALIDSADMVCSSQHFEIFSGGPFSRERASPLRSGKVVVCAPRHSMCKKNLITIRFHFFSNVVVAFLAHHRLYLYTSTPFYCGLLLLPILFLTS